MAFTNIETVKQHLSETGALKESFRDVPVPLTATSPYALLHSNLKTGSVKVKGKEIGTPKYQQPTLGSQPVSLSYPEVIPDSVVVASDSSLGRIFTENTDYHMDYQNGRISRIASGAIALSAEISVWYYTYRVYSEPADFTVNYLQGTIKRMVSGAIEDGQVVFVDYQTESRSFADAQITNAITEADDMLLKLIDPIYQESSDQTLITAETYLAAAILCRTRASEMLQQGSVAGGAELAKGWRELSESFENDGLKLAAEYAAKKPYLASPTTMRGGDRK